VLATPLETQVFHLAMADAMWISYVIFSAEILGDYQTAGHRVEEVA